MPDDPQQPDRPGHRATDTGDATPARGSLSKERARQAKAWSVAMDPLYGLIGFGLVGFGIDKVRGTFPTWTGSLGILGLVAGFWKFIREATNLNRESSKKWSQRPYRPVEPEPGDPGYEDGADGPDGAGQRGPKN